SAAPTWGGSHPGQRPTWYGSATIYARGPPGGPASRSTGPAPCPRTPRPRRLLLAVHLVLRGLRPRPDHQQVHVHVRGTGDRPDDHVRDVIGGEGFAHPGVDRGGPVAVTAEAVKRELVGADHAGSDLDHPHRLTRQFQPERRSDRVLAVLGGNVPTAALIGDEARRGPHHHDGAVAAGDQRGEQRLGHVQ